MRTYLTGAVVVLALVTSMGIFGFLSKAHMDQGIPTGDVAAQIQLFDEKIAIQKELISSERQNIEAARNTLSQMDAQLTARLDRGDSEASVERAVQIRAQQRRERNTLNAEIAAAQKRIETSNQEIQKLNLEKAPIAAKYRQIEAEADSVFVEDSTSNVDATNRKLKDSGGTTIVDYGASLFGSSGMVNLSASAVTIGAYPVYINTSVTATGAVSFGGGMAVSGSLGFYGIS